MSDCSRLEWLKFVQRWDCPKLRCFYHIWFCIFAIIVFFLEREIHLNVKKCFLNSKLAIVPKRMNWKYSTTLLLNCHLLFHYCLLQVLFWATKLMKNIVCPEQKMELEQLTIFYFHFVQYSSLYDLDLDLSFILFFTLKPLILLSCNIYICLFFSHSSQHAMGPIHVSSFHSFKPYLLTL